MSIRTFKVLAFILSSLAVLTASAQHELLQALEAGQEPSRRPVSATFKGSRLINGHSVMTRGKGSLEFIIAHRFGRLNTGMYELFGLDNANIRFGLEYGLTERLSLGLGRSSLEKTYDGFAKFAALRQHSGPRAMPISLTLLGTAAVETLKDADPEQQRTFTDRLAYTVQGLLARKFSPALSLQLMPTFIHYNAVEEGLENDLLALGVGGRIKLSRRFSFSAEYYYRFRERDLEDRSDALAFGIDLETGGHVFQFQLTNSRAMIEKGFIRETNGDFFAGDIHFGFNITRAF